MVKQATVSSVFSLLAYVLLLQCQFQRTCQSDTESLDLKLLSFSHVTEKKQLTFQSPRVQVVFVVCSVL